MQPIHIEIGAVFGRLTTIAEAERGVRSGKPVRRFLCRCECGTVATVALVDLRQGDTRSCGCLEAETRASARPPLNITHGLSRLPEYKIWQAMKDRCLNPRNKLYSYYGGRGITVCAEWASDFTSFLSSIGRRPNPKLQLDRIDNMRGYEPDNVRWATKAEQMSNRRPYQKRRKAA